MGVFKSEAGTERERATLEVKYAKDDLAHKFAIEPWVLRD